MQQLSIKYTPSHLYNNLSSNGENTAFVHLSEVVLVSDASLKEKEPLVRKVNTKDASPVYQAKWCKGNGKTFLTVGLRNSVQIFDSDGSKMLYSVPLVADHAIGIATCETKEASFILVGDSNGEIHFFNVRKDFTYTTNLKKHQYGICDLSTDQQSPSTWCSADQTGEITVWKEITQVTVFGGYGQPCTSVQLRGDLLLGAYLSGHIRLYNVAQNLKFAEICAHSQGINSISLHPHKDLFASVSDDTLLTVWQLKDKKEVSVLSSSPVSNSFLVGVQFSGEGSSILTAVGYDSPYLYALDVQ